MSFLCIYSIIIMLVVMAGLTRDKHKPTERAGVALLLMPVLVFPVLLSLKVSMPELLAWVLAGYSIILSALCIASTIIKKRSAIRYRITASLFFVPIAVLSVLNLLGA